METFSILKIKDNSKEMVDDLVVEEVPLTLLIGNKELVTILCMPSDLEDLVRGFLFTSGLIRKAQDIEKIVLDRERWSVYIELADKSVDTAFVFKRLYTSGCGKGTLFYSLQDISKRRKITSDLKFNVDQISCLMSEFQKKSEGYLSTGGAHSAALAGENGILAFREDIGRHNAIDKIIGLWLSQSRNFQDKVMLTSGRISSEVLLKIQKCRIPMIISRSAPTNQAVKLAKDMGITLVGFVRGNRMNIYSGEERINLG